MSIKTVGVLAGALWGVSLCQAADAPPRLSGSILGLVTNVSGVPQMGAAVFLYNRYDRLMVKTVTTDAGAFSFADLTPDTYSVRVSLASFLPVLKRDILVQPGMQSLLAVNLATVFSTVQFVGVTPGDGSLMSDDWKWVLRSANATRPILRLFPELEERRPERSSRVFSSTRGLVQVSGGDSGSALSATPDLGTAFALATSLFGSNQLQLSGNVGYSSGSGAPTTAFRTSYRRELARGGQTPELQLTMRQTYIPARVGAAFAGMQDSGPMLRTLSASMADETRLTEGVRFEYGFTMDSVTFLDRLNYFSPYGRITYDRGEGEVFQFSYSSGAPPAALLAHDAESKGLPLRQDLSGLALFPRVSLRDGRARVQRTQSWEAGYHRSFGARTFSVALYNDSVTNSAIEVSGAPEMEATGDLLPDVFSETSIFNAGQFTALGFVASLTQKLGDNFDVAVAFGSGGALTADRRALETGSPDELRSLIHEGRRHSLTTRFSGRLARTGTQLMTSYQWADMASLTPTHVSLTQPVREGQGWNLQVRQPIPYFGGLPGRLEANVDLRNLLAQGYIPLMVGQRRMLLMNQARSVRGGVSFIF
jgi:hypothetical protein